METFSTEIKPNLSFKFYCEKCDYGTSKKSNYNNHCESKKHNFNVLTTNSTAIKPILSSSKYQCDICNKIYTDRSGLWKHKKICIKIDDDEGDYYEGINIKDKDALVLHLLKQNGELQKSLIEMSKDSLSFLKKLSNIFCHPPVAKKVKNNMAFFGATIEKSSKT